MGNIRNVENVGQRWNMSTGDSEVVANFRRLSPIVFRQGMTSACLRTCLFKTHEVDLRTAEREKVNFATVAILAAATLVGCRARRDKYFEQEQSSKSNVMSRFELPFILSESLPCQNSTGTTR